MKKKTILHSIIFTLICCLASCVEKEQKQEAENKRKFEIQESIDEIILGDGKRY